MFNLQSPGVQVSEIDLSTVVVAGATTGGIFAGQFTWGPAFEPTLVDSEITLVSKFGEPDNATATSFYTAADFLQYGNNLNVVRVISSAARNACVTNTGVSKVAITNAGNGYSHVPTLAFSGGGGSGATATATVANGVITSVTVTVPGTGYTSVPTITVTPTGGDTITSLAVLTPVVGIQIKNNSDYEFNYAAGQAAVGEFAAKYPGSLGNGIQCTFCDSAAQFATWAYANLFSGPPGTSQYAANVGGSNDELHLVFLDSLGTITGVVGSVIEKYAYASKAVDAVDSQGNSTYYPNVIDRNSNWVRWMEFPSSVSNWGTAAAGVTFNTFYVAPIQATLTSGSGTSGISFAATSANVGAAGLAITFSSINPATDNASLRVSVTGTAISVSLATDGTATATSTALQVLNALNANSQVTALVTGTLTGSGAGVFAVESPTAFTGGVNATQYLTILEGGKSNNSLVLDSDVINGYNLFNTDDASWSLILTGDHDATVITNLITNLAQVKMNSVVFLSPPQSAVVNNTGYEHTTSVAYRNTLPSSDYAFMDGNWIRKYDKYNDVYRWVPCNGDVAGLCVRTDQTRDPWFSPAGLNRGNLSGVSGLAWNPRQAYRDVLYAAGINPIVSFPGQGALLYGDKTMQTKPSAFDRINVRRLFIYIEQAIAAAAKYVLFELNDSITQTQFRGLIDPFLRDIQGRRGIYAYQIVCDSSNNTPDVIDTDGFRGDIYIQPARSINYITLNFIATRTGVDFTEIVGQF